jgi:two-component system NtrC family sensor kinase
MYGIMDTEEAATGSIKEKMASDSTPIDGKELEIQRKRNYGRLFRRFVLLTVVCSIAPLLLVGWGINIHYTRFARGRMIESFQTRVDYHSKIIELFLREHRSKLQLIAQTHTREQLQNPSYLNEIFDELNRDYWSFTDLGLLDATGRHLAYTGPYDLMDKNYSRTFWFGEVMQRDLFISDMFMGFRQVPHFVIAVARSENGSRWILRATFDTEVFRSLVENVRIGKTGEVYLINGEGIFQTSPRLSGKIMEKSDYPIESPSEGIRVRFLEAGQSGSGRSRKIAGEVWLKEPRWLLVVNQDYTEAFDAVNHANFSTMIFLILSALTILLVSVLITRHMVTLIKKRDLEADRLDAQLMQTGKLAAIGELSAGVAHEINNPLAIILTERQILLDTAERDGSLCSEFKRDLVDSMSQIDIQIQRCKRITHNLLRFARRTRSIVETVDINEFIREVIELMEREAKTCGIKFSTDLEEKLPPVLSDPSQLQQVFLNMITNAIDAHEHKPYGSIHIRTRSDGGNGVSISIADTGMGIPQENLAKIFDPFFTTKAVGKGTGLGLSICYSTVRQLGGYIQVKSEMGRGTEFTILLPLTPPESLEENLPKERQFIEAA